MIWLLDTNVIVAALRRDPIVLRRMAAVSPDDLGVPSVAVAELAFGAERSSDPARAHAAWRAAVEPCEVVPFDGAAAEEHARLCTALGREPIGERDLLIAATAVARGLRVVSGNAREFAHVSGLAVEDWTR